MEYLADGKRSDSKAFKTRIIFNRPPIKTLLKKDVLKQIKRIEKDK